MTASQAFVDEMTSAEDEAECDPSEDYAEKAYVLISGSYSDYHIKAVYLDKDRAEVAVAHLMKQEYNDDIQVEEYEIGERSELWIDVIIHYDEEARTKHELESSLTRLIKGERTYEGTWYFATSVNTTDKDVAIKVARERRAEAIAKEEHQC